MTTPTFMSDEQLVRLIISDTAPAGEGQIFDADEIEGFLALEGGDVKMAAAQALDAIASNEAMVSKRIRTLDLQTDGPAVAKSLHDHAATLREQVVGGEFEVSTGLGQQHLTGRHSPELTSWPFY